MQQEAPVEPAGKAEPDQAPLAEAPLTPPASPAREVNGVAAKGTWSCLSQAAAPLRCKPLIPAQQQSQHVFLNT